MKTKVFVDLNRDMQDYIIFCLVTSSAQVEVPEGIKVCPDRPQTESKYVQTVPRRKVPMFRLLCVRVEDFARFSLFPD